MSKTFNVACVQNCASTDMEHNLAETETWVREAHSAGADLICLPENCIFIDVDDGRMVAAALPEESHPALARYQALAKELGIWLLAGSMPIRISHDRVNNRSYLIAADGQIASRYNKIHLFDVNLQNGESYLESERVKPGEQAVIADTPWGRLGHSICYDLRFAYLYRALAQAGADFLVVPAAFTQTTGAAHWHVLLRARAIETGCYVFAP